MAKQKAENPKQPGRRYFVVGAYVLTDLGRGKVWLHRQGAEGMETTMNKLELAIGRFFRREF